MKPGIHYIYNELAAPKNSTMLVAETSDKDSLLKGLATACRFPAYFGNNWDAAADCLKDSSVTHLVIVTDREFRKSEDFKKMVEIISDVYLTRQRPQLWICKRKVAVEDTEE